MDINYSDIIKRVNNCAIEVYNSLGNGFQENIYHHALAIEMQLQDLEFLRNHEMTIFYKGYEVGTRVVDFFVENRIIIEVEAHITMEEPEIAQVIKFLNSHEIDYGILVNFGAECLQFEQLTSNRAKRIDNLRESEINKVSSGESKQDTNIPEFEVSDDNDDFSGYYDDEGNKLNPDLVPKPSLCLLCINDENPQEKVYCTLTRLDQVNELSDFICAAYQQKSQIDKGLFS